MRFLNFVLPILGLSLFATLGSVSELNKCAYDYNQCPSCASSKIPFEEFSQGGQIIRGLADSFTWQVTKFLTQISITGDTLERLVSIIDAAVPVSELPRTAKTIFSAIPLEDRANLVCLVAKSVLTGQGHISEDGMIDYALKSRANWSKDCWMTPRCIIEPSSAHQTSHLMIIVAFFQSRFAIRSGGHNPNPGWANIGPEGVLINMANLERLELNENNQSIHVGPGNRWISVYRALEGTGRAVLGGRVPDVGVGGLLLGGGIPNFSSQYGLACNSIISYEIVLGNGTILTVDRAHHSDLWWALKGGSSNFGIVTNFELETIPISQIWYESRIYDPAQNERLIEAFYEYQLAAEDDPMASFAFSLSNNHTIVAWIYAQDKPYPDVFKMFYDIPFARKFIPSTTGSPYTVTKAFESVLGDPIPYKRDIIALSTRPNLALYKEGYSRWLEISQRMLEQTGAMMTFGLQPVTKSTIIETEKRGGNPMNIATESQLWYTSVVQWTDDAHDQLAHEAVRASGAAMEEIATRMGIKLRFQFINDATFDQDPLSTYGAANVVRLKAISRKYDPQQIMQLLQGNGHLLRKV